ncbi:MAG: hypothetical protein IPO28_15145 [Holophagaceae bacterium]|nr:hypothetical protein [Holophagaceae bacterium]
MSNPGQTTSGAIVNNGINLVSLLRDGFGEPGPLRTRRPALRNPSAGAVL